MLIHCNAFISTHVHIHQGGLYRSRPTIATRTAIVPTRSGVVADPFSSSRGPAVVALVVLVTFVAAVVGVGVAVEVVVVDNASTDGSVEALLAALWARPVASLGWAVIESLLNPETWFNRDRAPFQTLTRDLLPALTKARAGRRMSRVRRFFCRRERALVSGVGCAMFLLLV